jgi:FlaA1/EpsC-like NDP-sugar epimerase
MRLLRSVRKINHRHLIPDLVILSLSLFLSFCLRLNSRPEFWTFLPVLLRYAPIFIFLRAVTYFLCGTYDVIWRYVSIRDSITLLKASVLSTLVILAFTFLFGWDHIPRSIYIIDGVISTLGIVGIRILRRYVFEAERSRITASDDRRVLIYGAGATGQSLLKQYHAGSWNRGRVIGFIDDDPGKIGRLIAGVTVWGPRDQLHAVITQYDVHEAVVAFRAATGTVIRQIIELTRETRAQVRLLSETAGGRTGVGAFDSTRKLQLSDLLSRPQRNVDLSRIEELVKGKRVLVTGAGGSIGSELCRQIFQHQPSQLLLLDNAELHLYQIDQELRRPTDELGPIVPLLCDVRDDNQLARIFAKYSPQIVFHAAAFKHVHLVEGNPHSAILNNIEGTYRLVRHCLASDVENFVLISTDKAVNPVGIMGMTKRVCEMIVTAAGREYGRPYCSVRFGNVLGSSGSFVPLMQKQIEEGGPITVTHPEMQRYLMLIPEAVSLVLNAATLGSPGDILILRMGNPIRILDLAQTLITLYGKTEKEIPIIFTGSRPGEKLVEELYLSGNEANTDNPDILILPKGDAISEGWTFRRLGLELAELFQQAESGREGAVPLLQALVRASNLTPFAPKTREPSQALEGEPFPVLEPIPVPLPELVGGQRPQNRDC